VAEGRVQLMPRILAVRHSSDGAAVDLAIPQDLVWFSGHFPGVPILPGVVQVAWAIAMARAHLSVDLVGSPVMRMKFQTVIQPDDRVTLTLRHVPAKRAIDFEYRKGERPCSSGRVGVKG